MKGITFGTLARQCSDMELYGMADSQQGRYGLALIDSLLRSFFCDVHRFASLQK